MITDKLRPHHLERKALLYVRQSSAHQVLHNRESSALQYAMRDRLTALGWSESRDHAISPGNGTPPGAGFAYSPGDPQAPGTVRTPRMVL
jgi:hypothetical protein